MPTTRGITAEDRLAGQASARSAAREPVVPVPRAPSARFDESIYCEVARDCMPRLARMLGPSPWLEPKGSPRSSRGGPWTASYVRQSAAMAVGILTERDGEWSDVRELRELVRMSLVRWQCELRGDGWPRTRRARLTHGIVITADAVVRLLTEAPSYQTRELLDDVDRHVRCLTRIRPLTPWVEATLAGMLANSATVVRDRALVALSRERLGNLLKRQDPEGWFPERGGADVGRLSFTLDALAELYVRFRWEELEAALVKGFRFLAHFVAPEGILGRAYNSCGWAVLSPYGPELVASMSPETAFVAHTVRARCVSFARNRLAVWDDALCAGLGARYVLATIRRRRGSLANRRDPLEGIAETHFPNASISIHTNEHYRAIVGGRQGGALQVTWRNGCCLEDAGVNVVFPHRIMTSGRFNRLGRCSVSPGKIVAAGRLASARVGSATRARRTRVVPIWMTRLGRLIGRRAESWGKGLRARKQRARRMDGFSRTIHFGTDTVEIEDHLRCRFPCEAIVCQAPTVVRGNPPVDCGADDPVSRRPIIAAGGRNVEIGRTYRDGVLTRD